MWCNTSLNHSSAHRVQHSLSRAFRRALRFATTESLRMAQLSRQTHRTLLLPLLLLFLVLVPSVSPAGTCEYTYCHVALSPLYGFTLMSPAHRDPAVSSMSTECCSCARGCDLLTPVAKYLCIIVKSICIFVKKYLCINRV